MATFSRRSRVRRCSSSQHANHTGAVATKLIAAGALVDKAKTTSGCTPLYIAAQDGHLTVVTKLIAAGALVDKALANGSTPLYSTRVRPSS